MIDPVCVFSVQHTGTWFTCEFLLALHATHGTTKDDVREWFMLEDGRQSLPDSDDKRPVIQSHLSAGDVPIKKHISIDLAKQLTRCWPVIVPVRDPLLSLITHQIRHPLLDARYIVHALARLAELADHVTFLPVDGPECRRVETLHNVALEASGIMLPAHTPDFSATPWTAPAYNVTPADHVLKRAYDRRDMQPIEDAMPLEFAALLAAERPIRDLLEPLGYEGLPWWRR